MRRRDDIELGCGVARWLGLAIGLGLTVHSSMAHIVPPEDLHPVTASHRRMGFVLSLNPVLWDAVEKDAATIAEGLSQVASNEALDYQHEVSRLIAAQVTSVDEGLPPATRRETARRVFDLSTRAVASKLLLHLDAARASLADYRVAMGNLEEARQLWAAFEDDLRATDREAFVRLGRTWLALGDALGRPGFLGAGKIEAAPATFDRESTDIVNYVEVFLGQGRSDLMMDHLEPLSVRSPSFERRLALPAKLPPGSNINKQLPRPRQILNMATRGVDESETVLIALGDMAFDSSAIFGEPARSLGISCNTCHNKSITNPNFFIPGLSTRPGGLDVSNSFFAPHANNGHFDPIDIPDLRGIRFTSPYGRNGRFESLRDFTRNVIVNEFNGGEPDPVMLDGLIAYMLEFDFLPNPFVDRDGRLNDRASAAAHRGEEIFNRPFPQMADRSCASCHNPSDHFLDRKRHDIGSMEGAEAFSRDGALDTPTLLSARYTAPYFHDGRFDTLEAVNQWFNGNFKLGLSEAEVADLTVYVETIGDGIEAYEDTVYTLEAELEEFSFFLSTYEFLERREKPGLMEVTFETIAYEIRAHKWDIQDRSQLPVLDRLAELMDQASAANREDDSEVRRARVAEYRRVYAEHKEVLR